MNRPIHLLGIGAEGVASLSAKARAALASATFVAGGKRHLALAAPDGAETFSITTNLPELVARVRERLPEERCVVLASGDPLCFGIGVYLRVHLPEEVLVIEPAVSSLQLAFARVGHAWPFAALGTVHGRPLGPALLPLLGRRSIGILTHDGNSPAAIAAFFLERGLDDYTVWVCEDLGTTNERVTRLAIGEVAGRRFGDLNVVVLVRGDGREAEDHGPSAKTRLAVPPDARFARPESGPVLLTRADVRAVVLSRFHDVPDGPLWDLGAGLGGVAVGLARQFPLAEVVAVERADAQLALLHENRRRFDAWNIRVVAGTAPDAVAHESPPAGVFLGGSGGQLDAILNLVLDRLAPGGVFVADFVGLENLARTLERLRDAGWAPDLAQVQISHGQDLAGLTTLAPQRPVWVVRACRR